MSHKFPVPVGTPLHTVADTPAGPGVRAAQESATDTPAGGRSSAYSRGDSPAMPQTPQVSLTDSRDTRMANLRAETPSALDASAMQTRMLRPIPNGSSRYALFFQECMGQRSSDQPAVADKPAKPRRRTGSARYALFYDACMGRRGAK